jgi:hypothetical protein
MPIPKRFAFKRITKAELREYMQLCNEIEDGIHRGREDVTELIARWNARAGREYRPVEFTKYYGSIDTDEFVREALQPSPKWIADLTYAELRDVYEAVVSVELSESQTSHFLEWLEVNLPNANMSDLIYWPNEWFRDPSALHLELTADQALRYAMLRSGRILADAPQEVELPRPLPE